MQMILIKIVDFDKISNNSLSKGVILFKINR